MVQIPFPYTNAPGEEAQEGAGKLINVYVDRRGDDQAPVWRRAPGVKVFVVDPATATISGSASVFAASSVVNSVASIAGNSAVSGVGNTNVFRSGIAAMHGSAAVAAVSTYTT